MKIDKFCSTICLILGLVDIYSGCCSCCKDDNEKSKGIGSSNKTKIPLDEDKTVKGMTVGDKTIEDITIKDTKKVTQDLKNKGILTNKISKYINDKTKYKSLEGLNQFTVEITYDDRVRITFEGDKFSAMSFKKWYEIGNNFASTEFSISVITNNKEKVLFWNFKDNGKISLENLRNSLAQIDDEYRENRKSHYLFVKDESGKFHWTKRCYIDLSTGVIYCIAYHKNDFTGYLRLCMHVKYKETDDYEAVSSAGYYNGKYIKQFLTDIFEIDENGTEFRENHKNDLCIPTKEFIDGLNPFTIRTQ